MTKTFHPVEPFYVPEERDVKIYHLHNTPPPSLPPPADFASGGAGQAPPAVSGSPSSVTRAKFVSYELALHRSPGPTACPSCQAQVISEITYRVGTYAWLMCFLLIFCGLFLGCCLIPFFVKHFKDVYHTCPRCNRVLHVQRACC